MKDKLRKILKYSGIIFIVLFIFLLLEKSTGARMGLRHKKVLQLLLKLSLTVFSLLLLYKSFLGYRLIFLKKDYGIFLDILKTILVLVFIVFILNYLLNMGRILKKNIWGELIKLTLFIALSFGIIYDEIQEK